MTVDSHICKSTYDSAVNDGSLKYAERSGIIEFLHLVTFLLGISEFHKQHGTWYDKLDLGVCFNSYLT